MTGSDVLYINKHYMLRFTDYLQEYLSSCNYSLDAHPYLYSGLASVIVVGSLSLFFAYPTAIPDASGYV